MNRMRAFSATVPSTIRSSMMVPRYASYHESKMSALSGSSSFPFGAGILVMIASRISSTPVPCLAEASRHSFPSIPTMSSICSRMRSGSALWTSILLMTGTMARLLSRAR